MDVCNSLDQENVVEVKLHEFWDYVIKASTCPFFSFLGCPCCGSPELTCKKSSHLKPPCYSNYMERLHGVSERWPRNQMPNYFSLSKVGTRHVSGGAFEMTLAKATMSLQLTRDAHHPPPARITQLNCF